METEKMRTKPIPELTDKQRANVLAGIDKRGPDECWEWRRYKDADGYGRTSVNRKTFVVTRLMYYLATGKQPDSMMVCHTCDMPGCCNPAHLFLGTARDNKLDCMAKRRHQRGESHNKAVLTDKDVLAIRASDKLTRELAAEYRVCISTINLVRSGRGWPHVGGERRGERNQDGERNPIAKLTERAALAIKKSDGPLRDAASKYGVSEATVSNIRRGKSWRHLDA
jgi:hypothetical protein